MKHILSIMFLFFCPVAIKAQNLVPNPSFALRNACPTGVGQLAKCKYWYNPTTGTPEYLNACHDTMSGSSHDVGVPDNLVGTQSSLSNSYIGIGTFFMTANYREYARTDLPALMPDSVYRVLIKVSLADNAYYATNAPAVFFYKDMDSFVANHFDLPVTPQVEYSIEGNISDKINWVTLIDTFTADSAYTHLIIGNFSDDASTSKTTLSGTPSAGSYFYIDSISVEKIADPSFVNNVAKTKKISVFPNPTTGTFTLQLPGEESHVTITDITGRKVKEFNANATTHLQMNLAQGMYFVDVLTSNEKWNGKLVVAQ